VLHQHCGVPGRNSTVCKAVVGSNAVVAVTGLERIDEEISIDGAIIGRVVEEVG
jgi:hypothetical protein